MSYTARSKLYAYVAQFDWIMTSKELWTFPPRHDDSNGIRVSTSTRQPGQFVCELWVSMPSPFAPAQAVCGALAAPFANTPWAPRAASNWLAGTVPGRDRLPGPALVKVPKEGTLGLRVDNSTCSLTSPPVRSRRREDSTVQMPCLAFQISISRDQERYL